MKCLNWTNKLAVLALLAANAAWALPSPMSLQDGCSHISGTDAAQTFQNECLALSQNNAYFNPYAVGACARLQDNGYGNLIIYPCLVAIRNRTYSNDEVAACDNMQDETSTLSCFHSSGSVRQEQVSCY